jgi:hypothetical protein
MDRVLYECPLKYERWVKILLAFPIVLVTAMGFYFYYVASSQQGISAVTVHGFRVASIVLFATAPFILLIYWLVLPTKIFIHQDKIRIKYGQFHWNVRFDTVESVQATSGIPPAWSNSSVTSYRNQIEIVRKRRRNIRLSPDNRDQFLHQVNHALSDWKRMQGNSPAKR